MRKFACLAVVSLVAGLTAAAQERTTTDVTLSYSYIRANPATRNSTDFNLQGGTAEVALNPRGWFGVVGNFGGYHMDRFDSTMQTYLFGPRVYAPSFRRVTPFAEGLFGLAHTNGGTAFSLPASRNSFTMAPGAGLDIAATKHLSLRLGEVDYLMTNFREVPGVGRQVQNNLRVSTGLKFRF
jgi:opacity protein-like surface antigen